VVGNGHHGIAPVSPSILGTDAEQYSIRNPIETPLTGKKQNVHEDKAEGAISTDRYMTVIFISLIGRQSAGVDAYEEARITP